MRVQFLDTVKDNNKYLIKGFTKLTKTMFEIPIS